MARSDWPVRSAAGPEIALSKAFAAAFTGATRPRYVAPAAATVGVGDTGGADAGGTADGAADSQGGGAGAVCGAEPIDIEQPVTIKVPTTNTPTTTTRVV